MTHKPLILQPEDQTVTKLAGMRLSGDARLWESEIASQLAQAHPYLPAEDVSIEFNRLDPMKGAAVGSAKIGQTGVSIPLIIKRARAGGDPELQPTDIFFVNGRYMPLTPEAVKSAMQSREIGQPMGQQQGQSRVSGGNPYIGDLTGDASPLEYTSQQTAFGGAFGGSGKVASVKDRVFGAVEHASRVVKDPSRLSDTSKAMVMGAIAGGGHRALRDLEIANKDAGRTGKKLTLAQKIKAVGKGVGTGAAVGAAVGGVAHNAAEAMGIRGPISKHAAMPSIKDLASSFTSHPAVQGAVAGAKRLGARAMANPVARNAIIGGAASGVVGAGMGAATAGKGNRMSGAASGAVKGVVGGAAAGALTTHLQSKLAEDEALCTQLVKSADAMHPNDIANFRALLATAPHVLQGASQTNLRSIDLIMRHKGQAPLLQDAKVVRPNVMILLRDPLDGSVSLKFSGGPAERVSGVKELRTLLGNRFDEAQAALNTDGVWAMAEDAQPVTWDVRRQERSNARPVDRDGTYSVMDRAGNAVVGKVVMQMIRPDGQGVAMRLFVTPDGSYAVSPELFGVRVSGSNRLTPTRAARGQMGVFVHYVQGTPVCTPPMAVERVSTLTSQTPRDEDFVAYVVRDPVDGVQMTLVPSRSAQDFVCVKDLSPEKAAMTYGQVFLMPAASEWVKLTGRVDVAKSADQLTKVSSHTTDLAFVDGSYDLRQGTEAWRGLDRIGVCEVLVGMGMHKSADLHAVCEQARAARGEDVRLVGLRSPVLTAASVKLAEAREQPATEAMCQALRPSVDLLKAAAASGSEQALDVMLGLNFITPGNVRIFTDNIAQFDEVASKLASLLLASRLGLQHVREDAVKEAMEGIARTGEHLRLLQSASQFQRQQASAK